MFPKLPRTARIVINILAYDAAWLGATLAAAAGQGMLAALACVAAVALHIVLSSHRRAECRLLVIAALVGLLGEALLLATGMAHYTAPGPIVWLPPLWLVCLWMAFATLLNVSLTWLRGSWALAALVGFVSGPIAYYGGHRLGGMVLHEPLWQSLSAVGMLWAIALPLLLHGAARTAP